MSRRRNANRRARQQRRTPPWEPSAWLRSQITAAVNAAAPHIGTYETVVIPLWRAHKMTDVEEFTCDRCRQQVHVIGSGLLSLGNVYIGFGFCEPCADIECIPADIITRRSRS